MALVGVAGPQPMRLVAHRKQKTWKHGSRRRATIFAATWLVVLAASHVLGGLVPATRARTEEELAPSRQVVIIMRALAYDGNLKTRAGSAIDLTVLFKKGDARSEQMAGTMAKAFGALATTPVAGLPIVVSRLAYGGAESLAKWISTSATDMVYACEGLEAELGAITEVTRKSKVLTVGSTPEHVRRGVSLGVFQVDSRTTILLNLTSSRLEGAAFAADLLRLATVIR
jgi:hypothetical protein